MDPDPNIHRTVEDLIRFARGNPVDGFGVTTPEYLALSREMSFDLFATGSTEGRITEEYLLLVRKDRGFDRLDQLAGRTLGVVDNPRMSLALIWLDTVLLEAKLKRSSDFFRQVTPDRKVSQAVLPVFFGKIEACLVTRDCFEVMSELNPQLKQQLRILNASPPLMPAGFFFLKDSKSASRTRILDAITRLGDTPAGRQIIELAQAEKIDGYEIHCLDKSLELLNRHRRLLRNNEKVSKFRRPFMKSLNWALCDLRAAHSISARFLFSACPIECFSLIASYARFGSVACNDAESAMKGCARSIVAKQRALPSTASAGINKKIVSNQRLKALSHERR